VKSKKIIESIKLKKNKIYLPSCTVKRRKELMMNRYPNRQIAVFGSAGDIATAEEKACAREFASLAAREGYCLLVGGDDGVMGAAAEGVKSESGEVIAVIPQDKTIERPELFSAIIQTGLAWGSFSQVLVNSCHAAVFVGGGVGTLTEMCMTYLNLTKGVILGKSNLTAHISDKQIYGDRMLPEFYCTESPEDAVAKIKGDFGYDI
jgi:uncharacterized protein (TIGR00725 family)